MKTMNYSRMDFKWQLMILVAIFSCFMVGLKTYLVKAGLLIEIPQIWDVTFAGSIGMMVVGVTLPATLLGYKTPRQIGSVASALFGFVSLLLQVNSYLTEGGLLPVSSPWLPPISAMLLTIFGVSCYLGTTEKSRNVWFVLSWIAILIGIGALTGHLATPPDNSPWEVLAGQLSKTGAVYTVILGSVLMLLLKHGSHIRIFVPTSTIIIACIGIMASMAIVLAVVTDRFQEQRSTGEALIKHLSTEVNQLSGQQFKVLERVLDRWLYLRSSVGEDFYAREAKKLIDDQAALNGLMYIDTETRGNRRYAESPSLLLWMDDQLIKTDALRWLRELREGESNRSWYFPETENISQALIGIRPADNRDTVLIGVIDLEHLFNRESMLNHSLRTMIYRNEKPIIDIGQTYISKEMDKSVIAEGAIALPHAGESVKLEAMISDISSHHEIFTYLPTGALLLGLLLTYQLMMTKTLARNRMEQDHSLNISDQRFRSLFEENPDAIFCFDKTGKLLLINSATRSAFSLKQKEVESTHFHQIFCTDTVPAGNLKSIYEAFERALSGLFKNNFILPYQIKNLPLKNFDVVFIPIFVAGEVDGVFCVAKDITKRLKIEERQQIMERSLSATSNAVVITDSRVEGYPVIYANEAFTEISGYSFAEVENQSLNLMIGKNTDVDAINEMGAFVLEEKPITKTILSYRKDGTAFWNMVYLSPVRNSKHIVTHYIAVMNDITEKMEHDSNLAYQATHDILTGLGNRLLFSDRLKHDFELAKRNQSLMAVLFIDLDDFKPINDALGHKIGDRLLVSVAERLSGIIRETDTLARFGGDEFVLLLPQVVALHEAEDVAGRVLEVLSQSYLIDGHELHISASVGISIADDELSHPEKLLQQADMAMYKAKQKGKDAFEIYSADLDQRLSKRVAMKNDLQEAINKCDFTLEYQPLVNDKGEFCSVEALVRWRHPEKGPISPAEFVPLAEETGQIIQLGQWVAHKACLDANTLVRTGLLNGQVAVNLSPVQFQRSNFIALLAKILDETSLQPQHLELELTEGILMTDAKVAIGILANLTNMGISTAIDDFGTGYSSFSYLRDLPVNKVKIDKSFVDNVTTNEKDAAVCKGMINLAHELGLRVVAEGVETKEQFEYLKAQGCELFQGYYFAKPMPLEDLIGWIKRQG